MNAKKVQARQTAALRPAWAVHRSLISSERREQSAELPGFAERAGNWRPGRLAPCGLTRRVPSRSTGPSPPSIANAEHRLCRQRAPTEPPRVSGSSGVAASASALAARRVLREAVRAFATNHRRDVTAESMTRRLPPSASRCRATSLRITVIPAKGMRKCQSPCRPSIVSAMFGFYCPSQPHQHQDRQLKARRIRWSSTSRPGTCT